MTKAIIPQPKLPKNPPQYPMGGCLVKWAKYMANLAHFTGKPFAVVARGFQVSFWL